MRIQLSDHFSYGKLIRFTLPSITMMIVTSIYSVVDGYFISNFVGKTAFASVNLIIPYLQILGGVGAMLGIGGSALTAKTLGEGDIPRARRYFTMMVYLMVAAGVLFGAIGAIFLRPMAYVFGATDDMIGDIMVYGNTCMVFIVAFVVQYGVQSFLIVAEQPKLGLYATLLAGFTNMLLDFLFTAVFKWGVFGAALATGLSQTVGAGMPLLWFLSRSNNSALHFTRTRIELGAILKASANGSSEMMSSVSASITGILYNLQLMKYAGEDGVAAYGVVMYAAFIFLGIFVGYSTGSAPVMGYHYGAQNHAEIKNVLKKSLTLLAASAVVLTALAMLFARTLSKLFIGYDANLLEMTTHAFTICSIPFLFMWFNIYTSSFFTALNDGAVSAAISFMRALVLPVICILALPAIWQLDGVWYSMVASELLGVFVSLWFMLRKRKKYHY